MIDMSIMIMVSRCVILLVFAIIVVVQINAEWTFTPKAQNVWMTTESDVAMLCRVQGQAEHLSYELDSPNSALLDRVRSQWIEGVKWMNANAEIVFWIIESNLELDGLEVFVNAFDHDELNPINESTNCNYTFHYRTIPIDVVTVTDVSLAETDANTETDATTDPTRSSSKRTPRMYGVQHILTLCLLRWMGT